MKETGKERSEQWKESQECLDPEVKEGQGFKRVEESTF